MLVVGEGRALIASRPVLLLAEPSLLQHSQIEIRFLAHFNPPVNALPQLPFPPSASNAPLAVGVGLLGVGVAALYDDVIHSYLTSWLLFNAPFIQDLHSSKNYQSSLRCQRTILLPVIRSDKVRLFHIV
jgi:hypothetical protein